MNSLKPIQIIAKILKILAQIAFVFSIIGAVFSLAGTITLFCVSEDSALWQKLIDISDNSAYTLSLARCTCLSSIFTCTIYAVLCGFAKKFYADELAAGTPFDRTICKQMLSHGIIFISLSVLSVIIQAIIFACFGLESAHSNAAGFSGGIGFIILWLICRYGADVKDVADKNLAKEEYHD